MRVKDLFDEAGLGLRLLTDVARALDRTIRHVYTTDLPDPSRYLTPGSPGADRPDVVPRARRRRPLRRRPWTARGSRRSARAKPWARCRPR